MSEKGRTVPVTELGGIERNVTSAGGKQTKQNKKTNGNNLRWDMSKSRWTWMENIYTQEWCDGALTTADFSAETVTTPFLIKKKKKTVPQRSPSVWKS